MQGPGNHDWVTRHDVWGTRHHKHEGSVFAHILNRVYKMERWRAKNVRIALAGIKSESTRDPPTALEMDGKGMSILGQMDKIRGSGNGWNE
jgi:hypothetical protein